MTAATRRTLTAASLAILAGASHASPPPFTITSVARSDNAVPGAGVISSATAFGSGQGIGILKTAVNNSGLWMLDVHVVQTNTTLDEALLKSALGSTPYMLEGIAGYLSVPTFDHIANDFHAISLNNSGNSGLAMGLFDDEFAQTNPSSGAFRNTTAVPAIEGATVSAPGLAVGTVWNRFDANSRVQLNDANQLLVVSTVTESALSRRIVAVLQLDGAGTILSTTLIAKEGGPVGTGPDTWLTIAPGGHAAAMNNSGRVAFSGTTAAGTDGIYAAGGGGPSAFVATRAGPTPTPGINWGSLAGSPLDINSSGVVAFRGRLADASGFYTESTDAGELTDTAARTFGNGPLTRISGTLSNDADVDMFRIRITDPMNFSATTVPDPGNGFLGAAFDTVLTLVASPENGSRGIAQRDNDSTTIAQSTLTAPNAVAGREFYICISTPKSRCQARIWNYATNTFPNAEIWTPDPAGLVIAGGLLYWPDPSLGQIGRATPAGALQSPLSAPSIASQIAVDPTGGKIYWIDRGDSGAAEKIRRSNLDGSNIEDLITASTFGSLAAYWGTGLALDLNAPGGKLYWSRSIAGEINRCNLDGTNPERVIQDYLPVDEFLYPPVPGGLPLGNFAPTSLAVDHAGGKIYFVNTRTNRIQRANLDGTGRASITPTNTNATQLALDTAAGKVYWSNTVEGKIQRANLDGTLIEDVLSTPAPVAIGLDPSGGFVYWTNTVDRVVRRATLGGAGASDIIALNDEVAQQSPDGPGRSDRFFEWTRTSVGSGGSLPYQIKLTGATARHEAVMIAKGAQKVVAVGDVIPGTSPDSITDISSPTAALRISDRGDVLWSGNFYQPSIYENYLYDALFWNGERLLAAMDIPPGTNLGSQKLINIYRSAYSFDMSDSGEYAIVAANMQIPPYNFTPQPDNALLLQFTLPPACIADFNQSGAVTVQDIFDFLSAYFASAPAADVNGSGSVTVQDIFDFLSAYFLGC